MGAGNVIKRPPVCPGNDLTSVTGLESCWYRSVGGWTEGLVETRSVVVCTGLAGDVLSCLSSVLSGLGDEATSVESWTPC